MEEISAEDESTSSYMIQETKITDESAADRSNDIAKKSTTCTANNSAIESNADQNVCSTYTRARHDDDKYKDNSSNSRSSWIKKCFSADTISNNSAGNNGDDDIELAQTHSIILNADEQRHCKKVSL